MTKQLPRSCVELLQRMVSFNTINRMEEGIHSVEHELAFCLEQLALAWNLTALRLPIADPAFNLLVTHQVDSTAPWLLFDSHLDTVDVQGMTIDPFGGELRNGKIFGRGACDTKGTGAAMLWALKSTIERQQISTNVAILFCIEEEYSKTGVKEFVNWIGIPRESSLANLLECALSRVTKEPCGGISELAEWPHTRPIPARGNRRFGP